MARSVVLRGTARCPRCQLAPRWCICAGTRTLTLPFALEVLMHSAEAWKPTSTGNLIARVVPESRRHIYHHEKLPSRESVCGDDTKIVERAARTTWILHPRGDALADVLRDSPTALENLRVVVIDGTWSQATDMLRHVEGWGQRVSLPASDVAKAAGVSNNTHTGANASVMNAGGSRYWLRTQYHAGHFSTIEAVMILLRALGYEKEHTAMQLQFELHVYASLLSRGHKARAEEYLASSPIANEWPELVSRLQIGPNADADTNANSGTSALSTELEP